MYFVIKTLHILFVMSWMACVFVLPRVLLHYKQAQDAGKDTEVIRQLAFKLFRFGILMFVLTCLFGMVLWLGIGIGGEWLGLKLGLVAILFSYFLSSGWLLRQAIVRRCFPSSLVLRIYNESSLLFAVPIIYLAVSKTS